MALITTPIGPKAYELIGKRISEILAIELPNQATLLTESFIDCKVYYERFVPFKDTDTPAINVMFSRNDYGLLNGYNQDGTMVFNVDIYCKAKGVPGGERGDTLSMTKLQRLTGVCHGILSHQVYFTLGFAQPFITHRSVSNIQIAEPENTEDASSVTRSRLTVMVRATDQNILIDPPNIAGWETGVKLGETELGYLWVDES